MGYLKEKYTKEYYLGGCDKQSGQRYGAQGYEHFKRGKLSARYMKYLRFLKIKNMTVLDIGCGRGEIVEYCARKGAKNVVGIDFSSYSIEIASKLVRRYSNVELREMEAVDINEQDTYDIIFLLDVIEHIPRDEMEITFGRVYRALKAGGVLLIQTPFYKSPHVIDRSDRIEPVKGMHCNKQTRPILVSSRRKHGFVPYSIFIWGKSTRNWRNFAAAAYLAYINFISPLAYRLKNPRKTMAAVLSKLKK
jgi:2-polyprenyl-3-methyl-5-hydroxy-6-metoxy-1,4-benzoquinol methylase